MYCFAMYLKQEMDTEVYFDLTSFQRDFSKRVPELDAIFPVFNNSINIRWLYNGKNPIKRKIYKYLFNHSKKINIFTEPIEDFNFLRNRNLTEINYFIGYWQTDYFVNKLANKYDYFIPQHKLPDELLEYYEQIEKSPISVSMHVRRGDYFSKLYIEKYGVCTVDYYDKALKYLLLRVRPFKLFVFSDDLPWVKSNIDFKLYNVETVYVESFQLNSFWHIYLMSKCTHNVISNSTFSWWGAFLNRQKDNIVVAPSKWRFDTDENLALKEWIKIEV
jgi:hypothetical protein